MTELGVYDSSGTGVAAGVWLTLSRQMSGPAETETKPAQPDASTCLL
ncbi:hypothetical protein [Streptomyces sudanensis]|nr:hypothetical protein [Streptomyces sudanensis]MCP9956396.1 hypothetical protein [Streptomyces sudanensis]